MRRTRGFTLIEIIMALAILVVGSVAILGLYVQNLRLASAARREVMLAVMEKDIASKNQLAAFKANSQYGLSFASDNWLVKDYHKYNDLIDPTNFDAARYWPGPSYPEDDWIDVYRGYYFAAYTLQRSGSFFADAAATHGLYLYDAQFVDWDGYGWIDIDEDGEKGSDEDFGDPAPSHFLHYDSRKMGNYIKKIECVLAWNLNFDPEELFTRVMGGIEFGHSFQKFRFMVYNPDLNKF